MPARGRCLERPASKRDGPTLAYSTEVHARYHSGWLDPQTPSAAPAPPTFRRDDRQKLGAHSHAQTGLCGVPVSSCRPQSCWTTWTRQLSMPRPFIFHQDSSLRFASLRLSSSSSAALPSWLVWHGMIFIRTLREHESSLAVVAIGTPGTETGTVKL